MISLLPIGRVIALVAVVYAAFVAAAVAIFWQGESGQSQTISGSIGFAIFGATMLQLVLLSWFYFGWRYLWRWFPALNQLVFPDVNGAWHIKIHWNGQGQDGVVDAEATVKQDFLRISMEVRSPRSDSQTLIAQPKRDPESGRPILYYVYLVTQKALSSGPTLTYHGAAILKFSDCGGGELSGNYWTTQRTWGHFRLSRPKRKSSRSR